MKGHQSVLCNNHFVKKKEAKKLLFFASNLLIAKYIRKIQGSLILSNKEKFCGYGYLWLIRKKRCFNIVFFFLLYFLSISIILYRDL